MKSDAQRQAAYQARQANRGKARLNCWIAGSTKQIINELVQQHGKTIGDVIDLGIAAAANLLAGRLQVARAAPQLSAHIIVRLEPKERLVEPDPATGSTDTPPPPENVPTPSQHEQEQDMDVDARIRAAAFVVEP